MTRLNLIDWALVAMAVVMAFLIATAVPGQSAETIDLSGALPPPADRSEAGATPDAWRSESSLLEDFHWDEGLTEEPAPSESEQAQELLVRTTENYQRALESSNPLALTDERIVIIEEDLRNLRARRDALAERVEVAESNLVFRLRANDERYDSEDPRGWLQSTREIDAARLRTAAMRERLDGFDAEIQSREIQLESLNEQREEQQVTDLLQAPNVFEAPVAAADPQRPYRDLYGERLAEADNLVRTVLVEQVEGITLAPARSASPVDLVLD